MEVDEERCVSNELCQMYSNYRWDVAAGKPRVEEAAARRGRVEVAG